jgi:hypothetical protein
VAERIVGREQRERVSNLLGQSTILSPDVVSDFRDKPFGIQPANSGKSRRRDV